MGDFMKRCWLTEFSKCILTMTPITLPVPTLKKIDEFVLEVIRKKQDEQHHAIDFGHEEKRFRTGLMGECAIEQFYGCRFIDWSIGDSTEYNHADLIAAGADVGVKTSEMGNFPVIHKTAHRPELICIKKSDTEVIICGLATEEVLNKYQDDDLVKSELLAKRGTKTGFYGFSHLIKVNTMEELIKKWPTAGTADQSPNQGKRGHNKYNSKGDSSQ